MSGYSKQQAWDAIIRMSNYTNTSTDKLLRDVYRSFRQIQALEATFHAASGAHLDKQVPFIEGHVGGIFNDSA